MSEVTLYPLTPNAGQGAEPGENASARARGCRTLFMYLQLSMP